MNEGQISSTFLGILLVSRCLTVCVAASAALFLSDLYERKHSGVLLAEQTTGGESVRKQPPVREV